MVEISHARKHAYDSLLDHSGSLSYSKMTLSNCIVNADINTSAGIVYTKLSLSNSIVNADINTSAGIVYTKLSLSNSIVNADINTSAGIVESKISFDTSTGHNHDGVNSKLISTLITEQVLSADTNTVTFSSIPSGYKRLLVVMIIKATAGNGIHMILNNDVSSIYTSVGTWWHGSMSAASVGTTYHNLGGDTNLSTTFWQGGWVSIENSATLPKMIQSMMKTTDASIFNIHTTYASITEINRIDVFLQGDANTYKFAAGSIFRLYCYL